MPDKTTLALLTDAVDRGFEEQVRFLADIVRHPSLRGRGIGRKLLRYVIDDARERLHADRLFLLTASCLHPACHLYRSMGFIDVPLSAEDKAKYKRADVKMELWLNHTARKLAA
jgi:ribosomal protein S18 acetylase RimI-like enzyme